MKKLYFLGVIAIIVLLYFSGPQPEEITESPEISFAHYPIENLEKIVKEQEEKYDIKPENEAEIVWHDSIGIKTPCSIVYLHGFSASKAEGAPVHRQVAEYFGCNLFLARLSEHGLVTEEPMLELTADGLIKSAKEAIDIGNSLGDTLIVMSTSTGGTLALYLASANPEIDALVLYSPNIEVYDSRSALLNDPWGLQFARMINDSKYHSWEVTGERKKYWYNKYRYESLTHLQQLLEETMVEETFVKINQPVFLGYYYKNEQEQDKTVSVEAMLEMYGQLGTPSDEKMKMAFPKSNNHVIASEYTSGDWENVRDETIDFLEGILR